MVIAKDESLPPCLKDDTKDGAQMTVFIPKVVIMILIILASAYIIAVCLQCR